MNAVVKPVYRLEAPLNEWASKTVSHDEWLADFLRELAQVGDDSGWSSLVGVGAFMRLANLPPGRTSKDVVNDLLAGIPDEFLATPARWAHAEFARSRDAFLCLEELAVHVSHSLCDTVVELRSLDLFDPEQAQCLHSFSVDRDDLECVRVVLDEIGLGKELFKALCEADETAGRFAMSLPHGLIRPNERMQRIERLMSDAWWSTIGT